MDPPLSPSWAENTIMSDCTQESGHGSLWLILSYYIYITDNNMGDMKFFIKYKLVIFFLL
jgi:hypothetical protein